MITLNSTIKKRANQFKILLVLTLLFIITLSFTKLNAVEENEKMVRLAKISVDTLQLEKYNAALKEQMTKAVSLEPGVLTYYAVASKKNPSEITILEIYADTNAYKAHIATPHFKKYKETVKNMVKSLELVDVNLIGAATKPNQ